MKIGTDVHQSKELSLETLSHVCLPLQVHRAPSSWHFRGKGKYIYYMLTQSDSEPNGCRHCCS